MPAKAIKAIKRQGAEETFSRLAGQEISSALEVVWADGGFESKEWQRSMEKRFGFNVEILKRCDGISGF